MVEQLTAEQGRRFLLRPNQSLSWQGNVRIWIGIAALSLIIVSGLSFIGAWLVIPFAGIELAALGAAFYVTSRRCQRREVLELSHDVIRLEKGMRRKEAEWEMPRQFTRVWQDEPRHPFTPPKLHLQFRTEEVPLGPFLNMDDTRALIRILEQSGITIQRRKVHDPLWF